MKFINLYLTIIILSAIFLANTCSDTKNSVLYSTTVQAKTNVKSNEKSNSSTKVNTEFLSKVQYYTSILTGMTQFSGYFWVQKFYDKNDPVKYFKNSERFSTRQFLRIDGESLLFTPNSKNLKQITSIINVLK